VIRNLWHRLDNPKAINRVPEKAGVYELGNRNQTIIYIGESGNLRDRINYHVDDPKNECIRKNAVYFHYMRKKAHIAGQRKLFKEYKAIHHGKIPLCNTHDPSL